MNDTHNSYKLIEQSSGNWIVECAHCGATATYSSQGRAIDNTPNKPHCTPRILARIERPDFFYCVDENGKVTYEEKVK